MLDLWVIYEHPRDYPEDFIARRWQLGTPTDDILIAPTLEKIRSKLPLGLVRIPRAKADDSVIVEVWI